MHRIARLTGIGLMTAAVCLGLAAREARAANEGQADLDAAIEANLNVESLKDLSKVIDLAESAMKKGLDETNTDFAKKLYSGALVQRATFYSTAVFNSKTADARLKQIVDLALADLDKALAIDANQPQAQYEYARLNLLLGNKAKAVKALDAVVEQTKDEPKVRAKALVLRAEALTDPARQVADLNEAEKLAPDDVETLRARALVFLTQNKYEAALSDYDRMVKLAPDQADSHLGQGMALFMLKRYDDAIAAYTKALELAPDASVTLMNRSRAYVGKQDWKNALSDVDSALKATPETPDNLAMRLSFLVLRARIFQQKGDLDAAKSDIAEIFKDQPSLTAVARARVVMFAGASTIDKAIGDLEELRTLAPKNVDLLSTLALLYSVDKKDEKAVETYTAVLAEDKANSHALRSRGDCYLNLGKHAEAIADLEAALKLEPKDSGLLNNLAWALATSPEDNLRDGKRAIDLATEACALTDYRQAHILSTLASAYAESGDFETAIKWSKKAVELGTPELKGQLGKELESYQNKKPWREAKTPDDDSSEKPAEKTAGSK